MEASGRTSAGMFWVILPESFDVLSPVLCRLLLLFPDSETLLMLSSSSTGSNAAMSSNLVFPPFPSLRDDFRSLDFLLFFFGSSKSSTVASTLVTLASLGTEDLSADKVSKASGSPLLLRAFATGSPPFTDDPVDDTIEITSANPRPLRFDFLLEVLLLSALDLEVVAAL